MNQPRSPSAGTSRRRPRWLEVLICLSLFFTFIPSAIPSVNAQTRDDANRPIRKRLGPLDIFRPPQEGGTRDSPEQPPDRQKPERPPLIDKIFVPVPNLVGHRIQEARRMIRDAHLRLGHVREAESAEAVDRVIDQSLEPNSRVLIGTPIDVVVAQRKLATVPRLIGRTKGEALRAIADAGLRIGNISQEESGQPVDEVIRQSLRPGSSVPFGEIINIAVSQVETTTVPNLVGSSKDRASSLLTGARLKLGNIRQEESATTTDQVLRQSVSAGTRVTVGRAIDIVIAQAESTTVPNLVGSSRDQASSLLTGARLKLGGIKQEESASTADQVLRQSVRAGTRVPVGQAIDIVIAQTENTTVPNLVGSSRDQASSLLTGARLKLGGIKQEESASPADQVLRQSVRAGTRVPVGQAIDVVIAQAETVVVPDVVGRSKDQASNLLSGARLRLGGVRQEQSATAVDQVLRQSVRAGTRVPVGQTIDIVVAQAETTVVPNLSGLQLEEGFRKIANAKLQLGNVSREQALQSKEGVLRQTPEPGTRVPVNTKVDVVIASSVGRVKVPNLVGKLQEQATELVTASGFRQMFHEKAAARPRGEVLTQTPAAGVEVPLGTVVEMFTSVPLEVPNVIGRSRDEANTLLNQAGFKIGTVSERFAFSQKAGMIFSQKPPPGTLLAGPENIEVILSTGIPTWAIGSILVLVGGAVGFLIRGHAQKLPHPPPSTEQPTIQWSTRAQKDLGSQRVEAGELTVGVDIRVRPIIDRGTQQIHDGSSEPRRSDAA